MHNHFKFGPIEWPITGYKTQAMRHFERQVFFAFVGLFILLQKKQKKHK